MISDKLASKIWYIQQRKITEIFVTPLVIMLYSLQNTFTTTSSFWDTLLMFEFFFSIFYGNEVAKLPLTSIKQKGSS